MCFFKIYKHCILFSAMIPWFHSLTHTHTQNRFGPSLLSPNSKHFSHFLPGRANICLFTQPDLLKTVQLIFLIFWLWIFEEGVLLLTLSWEMVSCACETRPRWHLNAKNIEGNAHQVHSCLRKKKKKTKLKRKLPSLALEGSLNTTSVRNAMICKSSFQQDPGTLRISMHSGLMTQKSGSNIWEAPMQSTSSRVRACACVPPKSCSAIWRYLKGKLRRSERKWEPRRALKRLKIFPTLFSEFSHHFWSTIQ